jgi:hypothetical protein
LYPMQATLPHPHPDRHWQYESQQAPVSKTWVVLDFEFIPFKINMLVITGWIFLVIIHRRDFFLWWHSKKPWNNASAFICKPLNKVMMAIILFLSIVFTYIWWNCCFQSTCVIQLIYGASQKVQWFYTKIQPTWMKVI